MVETKLNDPKVNIEKYKKNKQTLQEGFTTEYKTCYPIEDGKEVENYTVSEQPGILESKSIEETFKWAVIFIFVIIISCIVFPVVAIWAIAKDAEERGPFRKLMLTLVFVGLFITAFPIIYRGGPGTSKRKTYEKANRLMTGVLLLFVVLFTWISVTGAKMWGMKITDEWDYSKHFSSSDRSFMFYFDVFGVSYDTGQKTEI